MHNHSCVRHTVPMPSIHASIHRIPTSHHPLMAHTTVVPPSTPQSLPTLHQLQQPPQPPMAPHKADTVCDAPVTASVEIDRNTSASSSTSSASSTSSQSYSGFSTPTTGTSAAQFHDGREQTSPFSPLTSPITAFTFTPLSAQLNPSCFSTTPLTPSPLLPAVSLASPTTVAPQVPPKPFVFADRFAVDRVLSKTIFGELKLCTDLHLHKQVIVKVSERARMNHRHFGSQIQEDVRKEAIIMRTLGLQQESEAEQSLVPVLTHRHIDPITCGLSANYLRANASSSAPSQLSDDAVASIASGKQFISSLVGEFETSSAHFLATEYAARGDLYTVLTHSNANDGGRVINECQARIWFKQLCQAVQYMHAQSTAHLDISVENICIDAEGNVKLIDHGLAARHPLSRGDSFGGPTDRVVNTGFLSNDIFFAPAKDCRCASCWSSTDQLRQRVANQIAMTQTRFPGFVAAAVKNAPLEEQVVEITTQAMDVDSGDAVVPAPYQVIEVPPSASDILASSCRFLLRPVCRHVCKPGKLFYMSTELYDARESAAPFDAYKSDSFSLGVILFILVTGVPPFSKANEQETWFRWFVSGEWMEARRYTQPVASHYTKLSPNCWDLVDSLFKPQHVRPTVDQILAHPWMNQAHPMSQPIERRTQRA
jgi:serine/threonine protein kinase